VILVLSVGDGVYGFTLDPLYVEFIFSHDNIPIPKAPELPLQRVPEEDVHADDSEVGGLDHR
jgi:hypothetical protein